MTMQHCPPLSGVEGSVESHFHVLGERERWNIDVLLRMLTEMLPSVHEKAIETCPFSSVSETSGASFSTAMLELYAGYALPSPFSFISYFSFMVTLLFSMKHYL